MEEEQPETPWDTPAGMRVAWSALEVSELRSIGRDLGDTEVEHIPPTDEEVAEASKYGGAALAAASTVATGPVRLSRLIKDVADRLTEPGFLDKIEAQIPDRTAT